MAGILTDVPQSAKTSREKVTIRSVGGWLIWALVVFFFINVFAVIAAVLVQSFGSTWFDSWFPTGWTTRYYGYAWNNFQLPNILLVTLEVALTVTVVALLIGAPTAYVLARRDFPGKRILNLCFLLPIMVPTITYGIPLATLLYQVHLGGTVGGVILANLVPTVPFVILVLTPFIEQIDPNIETAARSCGAKTHQVLLQILAPLIVPGLLASALLVLVQTVGLFEMSYLVSGPGSQTLVVALYYAVFASGIRPAQAISAMAVMYMLTTLILLVVALRFVSPTQMVAQVPDPQRK
ncbi:MAG: ABC transporter permease [Propionibacteriaceae bacterium]|nr:ABC transporter permease [Propionibacteriaceae bacterium]